jgi:multiple sugar transport system ATP-binding protein
MVAGLEAISDGEVRIGGRVVNTVEPRDRDVAMVFQNYALYPHMTVRDNIGFSLRVRGVPKAERVPRIDEAAGVLGLLEYLGRKPSQLSGGQRQRVAMGRAIVREPKAFLMDEPLSNLDARLRVPMRTEIVRIQRELAVTTLYVTHDQVEAMTMADRVAVMRNGVLQQFDSPDRVYTQPANLFVASFVGSPAMNLLEGRLDRDEGRLLCRVGDQAFALPDSLLSTRRSLGAAIGRPIAVGIRPESLGFETLVHVALKARAVVSADVLDSAPDTTTSVLAAGASEETTVIARLPAGTRAAAGESLPLAVDPTQIQFFELESGNAIR